MVTMFFAGLALGLANTATCLVTRAPVALIAVAESGGGSRWAAARALALFLAGRLGSYLALGALVGALAHRITLSDLQRPMGAAFAVLALALWLRGGSTGAPGSGLCLTSRRFWCHHLCPAGAALEVVTRPRPSRVGPRGAGGGFDG